jgi:hypothetical protein
MTFAVDTNILLDILLPDVKYKDSSLLLLTNHMKAGRIIISDIVYSELASQFPKEKLLTEFLNDANISLVSLTSEALWISANAWKKYSRTRDKSLQCNCCGKKEIIRCAECHSIITSKQHILSDFIIAGHALIESGTLLTRDRGFYRTYFPELKIVSGL